MGGVPGATHPGADPELRIIGGSKMKRKTYHNVLRAMKLISAKGYSLEEASTIALNCFDNMAQNKNGMPVEWYIEKIAVKQEVTK